MSLQKPAKTRTEEKKLSDFEKFKVNPFVEKAIEDIQVSRRYKSDSATDKRAVLQAIDPNTGEVLGHTMFIRQIEVDEDKFAKLYLSQFQAFWDLSKPAIRVFGYILTKMKPKIDRIEFLLDECMQYTSYASKAPIYDGLASLINAEIIARGYNEYVYFINPLVAFNGDRVSYVKTYVKKKKESAKNQLDIFSSKDKFVDNFELGK
jgi:intergrase/recombinase